jgi:hypothetical protein
MQPLCVQHGGADQTKKQYVDFFHDFVFVFNDLIQRLSQQGDIPLFESTRSVKKVNR